MATIISIAKIYVCPGCPGGKEAHAHILFGDGTMSDTFVTLDEAEKVIKAALDADRILFFEAQGLLNEFRERSMGEIQATHNEAAEREAQFDQIANNFIGALEKTGHLH